MFLHVLNYILGIFQAVKVKNDRGDTDVYIDGGLLCNYPVHAFDGKLL